MSLRNALKICGAVLVLLHEGIHDVAADFSSEVEEHNVTAAKHASGKKVERKYTLQFDRQGIATLRQQNSTRGFLRKGGGVQGKEDSVLKAEPNDDVITVTTGLGKKIDISKKQLTDVQQERLIWSGIAVAGAENDALLQVAKDTNDQMMRAFSPITFTGVDSGEGERAKFTVSDGRLSFERNGLDYGRVAAVYETVGNMENPVLRLRFEKKPGREDWPAQIVSVELKELSVTSLQEAHTWIKAHAPKTTQKATDTLDEQQKKKKLLRKYGTALKALREMKELKEAGITAKDLELLQQLDD